MLLLLAMAVGPLARWKRTGASYLVAQLWKVALASIALGVVLPLIFAGALDLWPVLAVTTASWIVLALGRDAWNRVANKRGAAAKLAALPKLGGGYLGMCVAHAGIAVSLVGIALTVEYSDERDVRLEPGESVAMGAYEFRFEGVDGVRGPNYVADQGTISVLRDGELVELLNPEKRRYLARQMVMTEAAIDPGLFRDIYVALGEPLGERAWAVRVHSKPFVRWVWLGGLLMALGGVMAALDGRYRRLAIRDAARQGRDGGAPAPAAGALPAGASA